ncbi:MAG: protein-export chaperone SecB, partial [Alphaproteobacteria bacterium]
MAENDAAAPAAGGEKAGETQAPPITLTAQYVKDLSFENPDAPRSLGD